MYANTVRLSSWTSPRRDRREQLLLIYIMSIIQTIYFLNHFVNVSSNFYTTGHVHPCINAIYYIIAITVTYLSRAILCATHIFTNFVFLFLWASYYNALSNWLHFLIKCSFLDNLVSIWVLISMVCSFFTSQVLDDGQYNYFVLPARGCSTVMMVVWPAAGCMVWPTG